MSTPHVVAIDVGSTVVKVSAISADGSVLARADAALAVDVDGERAALDAGLLWDELCRLTRAVVDRCGQPVAIGVAAQISTVALGDDLQPVAPVFVWHDRRAVDEAAALESELGDGAAVAGRRVTPDLFAPRLRWLARHEPEAWERTRWIASLKDYLVAGLTGALVTDPATASYTLLFDVSERSWSEALLRAAEVAPERVPPVLSAEAPAGTVTADAAQATGVREGTRVAVGGPDGSVGALGGGAVGVGSCVDVAGTTDVLLRVVDRPLTDSSRRSVLNAYLLPDRWTVGGPTGMTGGAIAWLCAVLGEESVEAAYERLGSELAALPPGADGVTFHTALGGERFPTWSSERAGLISGIRPHHGHAHLLRAAEEGAAFTLREGLAALEDLGVSVGEVRVSGGLSRRKEAMQLRADVWGRPVRPLAGGEATTIGAAMVASVCGDLHDDIGAAAEAMIAVEPALEPDAASAGAYDAAFARWQATRVEDAVEA